jgi:glycosyltransferase involved in cell wall biosynthesis
VSHSVTLLINSLRGGGAERVCATLANELHAAGWSVQVLVLNLRDAVVRRAVNPGIPVIDLGVEHARSAAVAVARYIRRNRPERFLVFNHQLAVLLVWLRALGVGQFAIVARNISTLSRKAALEPSFWHRRIVHAVTRAFFRHADVVIAQSAGMGRDLAERYSIEPQRLQVIHNPLAPRFRLAEGSVPIPWEDRHEEVLYIGRLESIKGLDLLIDAFSLCIKERPRLKLRLVGAGTLERELRERVTRGGLETSVIFQGYVEDTVPFFARARILAMTSHYEGFPNVLVEALSQGTPVVSVDCASGPAEIVENGRNGFLCPSRYPADFAQTLLRALDWPWDVADIRRTADRFSSDGIAAQYAQVLSACLRLDRAS